MAMCFPQTYFGFKGRCREKENQSSPFLHYLLRKFDERFMSSIFAKFAQDEIVASFPAVCTIGLLLCFLLVIFAGVNLLVHRLRKSFFWVWPVELAQGHRTGWQPNFRLNGSSPIGIHLSKIAGLDRAASEFTGPLQNLSMH